MAFGDEQNSGKINFPGVYKDPESGAVLTVTMEAGADALARLNWERIGDLPEKEEDRIAYVPGTEVVEEEAAEVPKEEAKTSKSTK